MQENIPIKYSLGCCGSVSVLYNFYFNLFVNNILLSIYKTDLLRIYLIIILLTTHKSHIIKIFIDYKCNICWVFNVLQERALELRYWTQKNSTTEYSLSQRICHLTRPFENSKPASLKQCWLFHPPSKYDNNDLFIQNKHVTKNKMKKYWSLFPVVTSYKN